MTTKVIWSLSTPLTTGEEAELREGGLEPINQTFIEVKAIDGASPPPLTSPNAVLFVSRHSVEGLKTNQEEAQGVMACSQWIALGQKVGRAIHENFPDHPYQLVTGKTAEAWFQSLHQRERRGQLLVLIGNRSQGKYVKLGEQYLPDVQVSEWVVYTNQLTRELAYRIRMLLKELTTGDVLIFGSPSAWENLQVISQEQPDFQELLKACHLLSLGPVTTRAIRASGYQVAYESPHMKREELIHYCIEKGKTDSE